MLVKPARMTRPTTPGPLRFYPSPRAVLVLALAAPVALLIGALQPAAWPNAWVVAPALGATLLLLVLADAWLAPACTDLRLIAPTDAEVGAAFTVTLLADFASPPAMPPDAALALDARLDPTGRREFVVAAEHGAWSGQTQITPARRGTGKVAQIWLRWPGPLGLAMRQVSRDVGHAIAIRPNIAPLRSPAFQTFMRDAQTGLVARRIRGEGADFEALADYEPGMDRRRIDWKSSARHAKLFAREYESERNNPVVFAFDCGQAMCEPIDGLTRIDRAVTAALTTAYVALRAGDRVMLFGFAAHPQVATPFVSGTRNFHRLQRAAAALDYRHEEPNFTLGLATLAARLQRRALVVVFSEFTDPTSAELMVEALGRLIARHRVLFVTMADTELAGLAQAPATDLAAIARAVTATTLAKQRALVLEKLRRLGVSVIEAPHGAIDTRLLDSYLSVKRAGSLG